MMLEREGEGCGCVCLQSTRKLGRGVLLVAGRMQWLERLLYRRRCCIPVAFAAKMLNSGPRYTARVGVRPYITPEWLVGGQGSFRWRGLCSSYHAREERNETLDVNGRGEKDGGIDGFKYQIAELVDYRPFQVNGEHGNPSKSLRSSHPHKNKQSESRVLF